MLRDLRQRVDDYGWWYLLFRCVVRGVQVSRDAGNLLLLQGALKRCGTGTRIRRGVVIMAPRRVSIGEGCYLGEYSGFSSESPSGHLIIGDAVQINARCVVDFTGGLVIGARTLISRESIIWTHSHGYDPRAKAEAAPLEIGEDVWIGARSIILPSVRYIGARAIIAAGAVVTKSVRPGQIVAGVPAKVVGLRDGNRSMNRQNADTA